MSEEKFQTPQTLWKKLKPLPTETADYEALYIVFNQNKKSYHEQLTSEERSDLAVDYAEMCSKMLGTVIHYEDSWNVDKRIMKDIKKSKHVLEFHITQYTEKRRKMKERRISEAEMAEEIVEFKTCVERAEELAEELNKFFLILVHARVSSPPGARGKGDKEAVSSARRVGPESINPDHYRELRQTWTECCVTADLCNKIINELHRINESDEEFVKKSLQEIHGEIIVGFCDDLRNYNDLLQISPLGQQLARDRPELPKLLEEANVLKNHVQKADVDRMYESFNRMLRRLRHIRRLTRCIFGFG